MKPILKHLLVLFSCFTFFSCSDSRQESIQHEQKISSHKIMTNEGAVSDSVLDSTLLAPDFTYPTLDGEVFTLSEQKGKVIVLNLWATWCGPCIKEIPDFIDLQNEFKDKGVEFVGIAVDDKGWDAVRPFVDKHEINYQILLDKESSIFESYPLQGLPNTYIINRQGEVAHIIISMTSKELLKPLLSELSKI